MRTSGGRGAEGWIVAIPILALIVAASLSAGGPEAMVQMVGDTLRTTVDSLVDLVRGLF